MKETQQEPFRVGELVPGTRWFMRSELGRGGMGVVLGVYRNEQLPDFCGAMKILWPMRALRSQCEPWFVQELELLTRFRHDNIVRVTDFGTTADDAPWFVMELLEGPTLRAVIREAKRMRRSDPSAVHPSLKPAEVWKIVREICAGLHYAHTLKPPVVHRDIKAENIVLHKLHKGARVVILDFGIANVLDVGRNSDVVIGTPRCFSPEMLRGEPVTAKADLYALAILVYELLTLEFPYDVSIRSVSEVEHAHLNLGPIPICKRAAGIPPSVAAALSRALSKDPASRQTGVMEFLNDLSGLLQMSDGPSPDSPDPAVTDPDVRTPPGVRGAERAGNGEADASRKASEAPAPGHWLDVDRARWGANSVVPSFVELSEAGSRDPLVSELVAGASDGLAEPLSTPREAQPSVESRRGSAVTVIRKTSVARVAVWIAAAGVLSLLGAKWTRWTASVWQSPQPAVQPAVAASVAHGATDVQTFEGVRESDQDRVRFESPPSADPPPPARAYARGAERPAVRTADKANRGRPASEAPRVDEIVRDASRPPPNLDDIVFQPGKTAGAAALRPGSATKFWPPPPVTSNSRQP